jgi:E3 ubiquitin-protein ligase UBR7
MFQCLGLGTVETGGCGEDWWHPGCLVGLGPEWSEGKEDGKPAVQAKVETAELPTISEDAETATEQPGPTSDTSQEQGDDDDPPPPPGFPAEDDFEGFICYKCVEAYPWIRRYASAPGFLPPVYYQHKALPAGEQTPALDLPANASSVKRKADNDETDSPLDKKQRLDEHSITGDQSTSSATAQQRGTEPTTTEASEPVCKLTTLLPAPAGKFSLFFTETFRGNICHCPSCFPLLIPHPQLMEEEETYEPPVSEDGSVAGGSTNGGGSLLDRGESALQNVDRVRAIEGVMAYNHLKDKLKPFFQQFAESGQAISAEDIKEYFAKLRGDETGAKEEGGGPDGGLRREQSGY